MGRAMIIICAGVLVSLGIISMSTADQGKLLTQKTTTYANEISAKNAAHTGIQIAMQKISDDTTWAEIYNSDNPWTANINKAQTTIHVEYLNDDWADNDYWKSDSIRIVSKAIIGVNSSTEYKARVISVYEMAKFSDLVPEFTGALQLPSGYGSFTADGSAHAINGVAEHCEENKPPVTVNSDSIKTDLESNNLNMDNGYGEIAVDPSLDYEPTDELIKRLKNTDNVQFVNSDFGETLGSAEDPGVFFIDGNVKLSGSQKEGFGILVIQEGAGMEMENNELSVAGNFTFNGLVIFENAFAFDGHGTPTINGSVLIGETDDTPSIDINIGGDIEINYDCDGENYAKMAAANLVDQNKYKRVVTYE